MISTLSNINTLKRANICNQNTLPLNKTNSHIKFSLRQAQKTFGHWITVLSSFSK
jgi:hypothetical protein